MEREFTVCLEQGEPWIVNIILPIPRGRHSGKLGSFNAFWPIRTNSYEYRLWKYSKRGFAVAVPGLVKKRISGEVFTKTYSELQGFSRLLFFEVSNHIITAMTANRRRNLKKMPTGWRNIIWSGMKTMRSNYSWKITMVMIFRWPNPSSSWGLSWSWVSIDMSRFAKIFLGLQRGNYVGIFSIPLVIWRELQFGWKSF